MQTHLRADFLSPVIMVVFPRGMGEGNGKTFIIGKFCPALRQMEEGRALFLCFLFLNGLHFKIILLCQSDIFGVTYSDHLEALRNPPEFLLISRIKVIILITYPQRIKFFL